MQGGLPAYQRLTVLPQCYCSMPRYLGLEESLEFPRTVNFTGHLTWLAARTDQCTASAVNPVHPTSNDYFPGFCRHRSLDQLSVLTRPLPGGYQRPIT
ncbi:hypothetical protein CRENBAI_011487 [Crenichthys baileyi]|uniref:Uncharacterized protein n=1 Tax=Crenichthys baileyi TaxID=28760 RepID=A0AAV9QZ77_9TELE